MGPAHPVPGGRRRTSRRAPRSTRLADRASASRAMTRRSVRAPAQVEWPPSATNGQTSTAAALGTACARAFTAPSKTASTSATPAPTWIGTTRGSLVALQAALCVTAWSRIEAVSPARRGSTRNTAASPAKADRICASASAPDRPVVPSRRALIRTTSAAAASLTRPVAWSRVSTARRTSSDCSRDNAVWPGSTPTTASVKSGRPAQAATASRNGVSACVAGSARAAAGASSSAARRRRLIRSRWPERTGRGRGRRRG